MGFSLSEMWGHMGWPAITVAVVLMVMGLSSLTVFIERLLTMRRSRAASAQFAAESGGHLREEMLESVIAEADKYPNGHLPRVVKTAYDELALESRDERLVGITELSQSPLDDIDRLHPPKQRRIGLGDVKRDLGPLPRVGRAVRRTAGDRARNHPPSRASPRRDRAVSPPSPPASRKRSSRPRSASPSPSRPCSPSTTCPPGSAATRPR
jgi:hypothetical protein